MINKYTVLSVVMISTFFFSILSNAFADELSPKSDYKVSQQVSDNYANLIENEAVKGALAFLKTDQDNTVTQQILIAEIAAPPFHEQKRAEYFKQQLESLGLQDVQIDNEGNVYGIRPGTGNGPVLFISAHLDTVFDYDEITVKNKDGVLYAPGISDDSRGLAALLSIMRAFNESGVQTTGDIIFGADVGEEGLGDLRGVKAFFKEHPEIDGYISIDNTSDGVSASAITYQATGSHRYKADFKGPGGHSYKAFGLPSPIHAMGRAIAAIADVKTPEDPRTTFTVGIVEGGTSVNAIAAESSMYIDMRSTSAEALQKEDDEIMSLIQKGVGAEDERWGYNRDDGIDVVVTQVGNRPVGSQDMQAPIVQAAWASTEALGLQPSFSTPSSTDSNLPISLGIPALTLGGGGEGDGFHSPGEWYDPTDGYLGPQKVFLTMLGLVGVEGISTPILEARDNN